MAGVKGPRGVRRSSPRWTTPSPRWPTRWAAGCPNRGRGRLVQPDVVIALDRVPGLDQTQLIGSQLRLGARVTLRDAETGPEVRRLAPVLADTFPLVANVRVRNVATIGGNVAEADYASDPPCVLLALDAAVEMASTRGTHVVSLSDFLTDYYETVVQPDELPS